MANMVSNLLLGRLPTYTRKARHLDLLRRYARPATLLNMARTELALARGDIVVRGFPYIYTIDTGNVCNLRCPLCPTGYHGLKRSQALMTLQTFEIILGKIKNYAIEVILHNWGEPFLNPDILPIIALARESSIGTTISSNLNLVHKGDDYLREVVDSGLSHLTVSVDGTTQEVYEKYRVGGDLEHVLHNMRVLLDYRKTTGRKTPKIEWQFLVFKHNQHQMDDARRIAREIGVDRLRFTSAGLPFDDLADVEMGARWIPDLPEYQAYDPRKIQAKGYMHDERCFYLYRGMTVNPGGEVAPCCVVHHSEYDFGSLLTDDLADVWNNSHYRSSRSLFSKQPAQEDRETVCGKCPLFKYEGAIGCAAEKEPTS